MVAGPQSLNNAAAFSPQLTAFRDHCAGARLPTHAGATLPARCYNTRVRRPPRRAESCAQERRCPRPLWWFVVAP
jgi:hypothetical protein